MICQRPVGLPRRQLVRRYLAADGYGGWHRLERMLAAEGVAQPALVAAPVQGRAVT